MQPILFQKSGVLTDGEYLPGCYSWPYDVQLNTAQLDAGGPANGSMQLTLEVGGVLTATNFTVGSAGFKGGQSLSIAVKAGQTVRWKVSQTGNTSSDWPNAAALSMSVIAASVAQVSVRPSVLKVIYVSGGSSADAYTYNSLTHAFTPTGNPSPSITDDGTQFLISLMGSVCFKALGNTIYCDQFYAVGLTFMPITPRLEFLINNQRVATVTATGVFCSPNLFEVNPVALAPTDPGYFNRFEFWSGGVLTATLDITGLTAANLVEGIT